MVDMSLQFSKRVESNKQTNERTPKQYSNIVEIRISYSNATDDFQP